MAKPMYDFAGWATRNGIRCSDGRIIRRNAFQDCDGLKVPLVWNHDHNRASNVLGHALLENHPEGVYAYCYFNNNEEAQKAKEDVVHGDVCALSIYANKLKQKGNEVLHGAIKEVSLVLAGANPGAMIESIIAHGEESDEEAIIYSGIEGFDWFEHADEDESEESDNKDKEKDDSKEDSKSDDKTIKEVFESLSDDQKTAVYYIIGQAVEDAKKEALKHSDEEAKSGVENIDAAKPEAKETNKMADKDKTVKDVFDTLNEEQKTAVYYLIGQAVEDAKKGKLDDIDDDGEEDDVKHNAFEGDNEMNGNGVEYLSHSEFNDIVESAKRNGSLKDAFLQHGIDDIEYLFPEDKMVGDMPNLISRDMGWVSKFMGGVKHTPFSRIKSIEANITEADARAKGYIKGNFKKEEVFSLLKRTTTPQTVYKKQKLDRDDVIDITDLDIVAWIKKEMRVMLDEEIARAGLIGDGRDASSDDKISELNIRPIWKDADLYTIKAVTVLPTNATDDTIGRAFIRAAIKARKTYKGSGNPSLFTTEDMLTNCLLIEDGMGRIIYDSVEKLATALRVKEIVTVPVMEDQTRVDDQGVTRTLDGIIVNLADYVIGADKGGAVNMFDDFDIDYNQLKYLIETRCSGAMVKPFGAIALEHTTSNSVTTASTSVTTVAEAIEAAIEAGMATKKTGSSSSSASSSSSSQG